MLRTLFWLVKIGLVLAVAGAAAVGYVIWQYSQDLPDYQQLADYHPAITTRVYASDGSLIAEHAIERRIYVPISAIPERVKGAFISAEDQNFYEHPGVDVLSILRAAITNLRQLGNDKRPIGASTITQQVAKNFLLTNEVSIKRKVREALLALKIEQVLTKEQILELYLNEIYLGRGSYGVADAALNYFGKSLDELTVAEAAYLAELPKAPNNYNPYTRYDAALARRNWVLSRMHEDGRISDAEYEAAVAEPLVFRDREETRVADADFFSEEVRRELYDRYGEDTLYKGGLTVYTSLDPALQAAAEAAIRKGLFDYDRRHGWRGAVAHLDLPGGAGWEEALSAVQRPAGALDWKLAVVLGLKGDRAEVGLDDGSRGTIPMKEIRWAAPTLSDQRVGRAPDKPDDVLDVGDVVLVEPLAGDDAAPDTYALRQVPNVNGALVAMDPQTGRVLAMVGGWSYGGSEFNRATQALRQPGSAFKPFVYMAALDAGFEPDSIILDAPFVVSQGEGMPKWRPSNYSNRFYGPTPMRVGIELSRNLMTVRLANAVGAQTVVDYGRNFGVFAGDVQPGLSLALGSGETTLLRMTRAYAMIDNGGKEVEPTLIDRIQDRYGRTIFRHDQRLCDGCEADAWNGQEPPTLPDGRRQIADPATTWDMVEMLEGVVQRGTGTRAKSIGKPLAGKTGTSNDSKDAWFLGFSPGLVTGVYVGFDQPRTLGSHETGASAALPIWVDFMKKALEGQPATPFVPPEETNVQVVGITAAPLQEADRSALQGDSGSLGKTIETHSVGAPTKDFAPSSSGLY